MRLSATIPALLLAACGTQRQPPADDPSASPETGSARITPADAPMAAPVLDLDALHERRDPERVLRFYAAALKVRDWDAAARAWGEGSGITPDRLAASYDKPEAPTLTFGKGEQDGAAGSLYYEVPAVLAFGAEDQRQGRLILRRVNDVDGAQPRQLRWHIEKSSIGP